MLMISFAPLLQLAAASADAAMRARLRFSMLRRLMLRSIAARAAARARRNTQQRALLCVAASAR